MTWVTGGLVFIIIWWLVFFITLPIGVRAQNEVEDGEDMVPGTVESAPLKPRVGLKALITTAVSAVLFGVYWYVTSSGLISFRPD